VADILLVILRSCSLNTMHCMALPFVQCVAQTKGNSYFTIPDSWLHKVVRTREIGSDGVSEFSIASLQLTYNFVWDLGLAT